MATSCSLASTASQMPCQRSATSGEASGSPTKVSRRTPLAEQVVGERDGAGAVLGVDRVERRRSAAGPPGPAGCRGRRARSTTSSLTVRPRMTSPSQRPAIVADRALGVVAAVGGQDQHRAAQLGGDRLVAEHDLGVVGAGQVGEDDAVGGVPALGELPAELAGRVVEVARPPPCTRSRVSGRTSFESRMTRETVAIETPACRATSRIVAGTRLPSWLVGRPATWAVAGRPLPRFCNRLLKPVTSALTCPTCLDLSTPDPR